MSESRFVVRVAIIAALVLAGAPVPSHAASSDGQGIVRQLGDLFGGSKENDAKNDAGQPSREVPSSRQQIQLSFAPLVKETAPAVVNVYATRMIRQRSPFGGDPFFERFFGQQFRGRSQKASSLGSGVIVDKSGLVVTNYHVIEDADEIKVALDNGREYECTVVLKDQKVDLAVLRIKADGQSFPTLPIGNSDAVEIGDLVLAIGDPFGVGQTVTSGIVSAMARTRIGSSDFSFYIQTDAAINPGNSGGPLIDMSGQMVGINSAIYSRSGGSNGIGFAIPANLVKVFVAAAEAGQKQFELPYIGATFEAVTSEMAEALNLQRSRGAIVNSVVDGGPAAKAGLHVGDVVTALNDKPVEHPDALGYRLATTGIGQVAKLTVVSRDETRTVSIELDAAPETVPADEHVIEGNNPFSGAKVANLSPRVAQDLGMPTTATGVVVTDVEDGTPAAQFGFQPQDIIVAVNRQPMKSVKDLDAALGSNPGMWSFDVNRGGQLLRQFVR